MEQLALFAYSRIFESDALLNHFISETQQGEFWKLPLVGEFNQLAKKINQEQGLISDCMLVTEPQVELVDGVCTIRRN